MSLLDLEWWAYLFMVLSFFIVCLGLNYVVKKINEAKIDERFIRMLHKASTTQATQVNGPLIVMETSKGLRQNSSKSPQPSPTGISLVFNQEDNKRKQDLEETFNIIKNTIDPKKFESLSLNSKYSQETVALPIIKSDYVHEIVSNKIIESANKVNSPVPKEAKETSSLAQNLCNGTDIKSVLVKRNEYGQPSNKETDQSDCYVTEVMTVKNNDVGYVACLGNYYNKREVIAFKDTERIIAKETTYLVQSDNNERDSKGPKPKSESTDESPSTENDGISSAPRSVNANKPSPIEKNELNRTDPKPNVPEFAITESKFREAINRAKEELDAISLKKKALSSNLLKTADTTATTKEGTQSNKPAGSIAIKETLPQSGRNVTESSPAKIRDPKDTPAKDALPHFQTDIKSTELCPVKLSDSGNSTAKNYSSHIQSCRYMTEKPVKISDSTQLIVKNDSFNTKSDPKMTTLCPVKMSDSDAAKNISSHALSVQNVTVNPLKSNKSGQLTAKDTSLHIKSDNSITKLSSAKKTANLVTSSNTRSDQKVKEGTDKKEENLDSDKSASHTQSDRHVPAIISVMKSEPRRITDQVTANIRNIHKEAVEKPLKIESDRIITTPTASPEFGREAAKATSLYARSDRKESDEVTVKKDLITTTATPPNTKTHSTVTKGDTTKKSEVSKQAVEPTSLPARNDRTEKEDVTGNKEPNAYTLITTSSHTQTDHSADSAKKSELGREAIKATLSHGQSVKKSEDAAAKTPAIIPAKMSEQVTTSQTTSNRQANEGVAGKKEEIKKVRKTATTTSSSTQTDPKITKFGKRYEHDRKDIKGLSTLARSDYKTEEIGEIEKAGSIAAKATASAFPSQSDRTAIGIIPVTMSGRIAAQEITINTPSNRNLTELVPITMTQPHNNEGEETTFTKRSDVANIRINEPEQINIERSVPGISAIKKSNTRMQSSSLIKKTIDSNVTQNDESRGANESQQIGLKERIKALLTPPVMNEDIMVLKPNPSSKK